MKKTIPILLAVLALSIAAYAEGSGGLAAVKTDEGVFLSWNMTAEGAEYTVYRDGEAIAVTALTNYTDIGADGSAEYSINGLSPVSVWEKQYLEIPISAPTTDYGDAGSLTETVYVVPVSGTELSLGSDWTLFPLDDGSTVFINADGKVLDVSAQSVEKGGNVGVYSFNNGENQKFFIEKAEGGCYIRGKQSKLYLSVDGDGAVTIQDFAQASLFSVSAGSDEPSENALNTAKSAAGEITYSANDASVGDLDGDGEFEIVLKWDPSDSKDASQNGKTGKVFLDAYKLDGTRLWRIDLGVNVRAGAHDTQFLVYDLDGDGCAEVAFRTADGTVDGAGGVIGDPNAVWTDNGSGKNLEGPLWVTVFDGKTGAALASIPFDPQSDEPSTLIFGDDYGNRSERYNACIAYLDGENPYMVFQRGYYTGRADKGPGRTVIAAYSYKNGQIEKLWRFDTMDEGNEKYIGQGNHNISVGDADGDGKDEIFTGALALDHDGSVMWCSFMGHGDAMHLGDFDPEHEGLELFAVHEDKTEAQSYGFTIFDAASGEILHAREAGKDTGRGLIANVGAFGGNYVAWAGSGAGMINSLGEDLNLSFNSMNFRIYWDGDLYDELLDGTCIYKITDDGRQEVLLNSADDGCASNNSTKANPCLQADLIGDWREEVIWRSEDNSCLRLYTTTIPTDFAVMPLMSDHIYEMGTVWQNSSYNQPPHLGYYLGGVAELEINSETAKINGKEIILDVAPYIENGRALVPLRFIGEAFGASVEYGDGAVTVRTANNTVAMSVGSTAYTVNGAEKTADAAPVVVNGSAAVPLRAVAEALGLNVEWDGESQRITVKRGGTNETEEADKVRIFIAGDSTAQSYRDNMAPQAGWGQMLGLFFDGSVEIVNRAIAGRSLKSFYDEGRWASILEDAQSGDFVIIQFGQNDGAWNKPERYISHEDFAVMLEEEYIKPALEKGLIPIIATRTQGHWFDESTGLIGEPSDEISYDSVSRDAARKYNLTLLEINNLSRALENKLGEEESRKLHLYAEPLEYEKYPDGVADNTHFSYFGAFKIAEIAAEELEQLEDLRSRRIDGYAQVKTFDGEYSFDVRPYSGISDEFRVAVYCKNPAEVSVNGIKALARSGAETDFITRAFAKDGKIEISASAPVTVEVSPIWKFAPDGGIDTAENEFFADLPDGIYDFSFTKSDNNRGSIYINSLLVGANVDMYGTVEVPEGTVYTFDGFETENGASIKVDQKTTALKSVEAAKSPSIFKRKTRIFVGGDSTVCNYYPIIPDKVENEIAGGSVRTGWAQLLSRFVSDEYEVVNLASSGDWARNWKDTTFPTVLSQGRAGDILIIQFGINDRNRDDKSVQTMKAALEYMIEECDKNGIIPILVKPQPSVGYSWGSAGDFELPNGNNGGFFDAVKEVADETGCAYVDLYSLAAEHFAEVGREYVSKNYQLWNYEADEISDKLHISFAGARKLCSLFAGEAERLGLIASDGYYEVTKIVSDVYLFENGEKSLLFNNSDMEADVTLTYADGAEAVTVAPKCEVKINTPSDMTAEPSAVGAQRKAAQKEKTYIIENAATGLRLAVTDGSLTAASADGENSAFLWNLNLSGGAYILKNSETKKVVDVPAMSTEAGTGLIVYSANYGDNQKWLAETDENGCVTFTSESSGLCMECRGGAVVQNNPDNSDNQKWRLIEVTEDET